MSTRTAQKVLALAGGAGAGKTALARRLQGGIPRCAVIHLDDCLHTGPGRAPTVPAFHGEGEVVDFSDPLAIDLALVRSALRSRAEAPLLVVEGTFALALPLLRRLATWSVYVDAPADVRLARKMLRKLGEGADLRPSLHGYLERGRRAHDVHVAPGRELADLVVDGVSELDEQVRRVRVLMGRRTKGHGR
ncbi:hypothetical protein ACFQVC_34060 [Streptomyces monticola]|uniref:Phosphoribulokinase/uridine kinase domain-containing protein n=1 Tax=Streptomyces monticola TaxID=2666263 RepID=A0ABW2JSR1_9ACTN